MLIYRFRITCVDQEDFIREIEIQPTQTFLDFHEIIMSSSDLAFCQNATFFNTDKKYKPHSEITLKPQKKQIKKYDEELDEVVTVTDSTHLMKDSQLKRFIEDPHQRMIYEYTGKDFLIFNLELFKIQKTEETYLLPRCIKKVGELPKPAEAPVAKSEEKAAPKPIIIPPIIPDLKESDFEDMHEDEEELAEIESNLDEFLDIDEEGEGATSLPSIEFGVDDPDELEHDDRMESLEDYDDIENLEMKHRDFDRESDDY